MDREWFVRLDGEPSDIKDLSEITASGWRVEELPPGVFYLGADCFLNDDSSEVVLMKGKELLAVANGAALLHIEGFTPVLLGQQTAWREKGKSVLNLGVTVPAGRLNMRSARPAVHIEGQAPIRYHGFDDTEAVLAAATRDDAVWQALYLFGSLEHTWRNLYMILEVIEEAVGGETNLLEQPWADERLKAFKATANNWNILKSDARHAKGWPAPKDPLEIGEARELIGRTLMQWIATKANP